MINHGHDGQLCLVTISRLYSSQMSESSDFGIADYLLCFILQNDELFSGLMLTIDMNLN